MNKKNWKNSKKKRKMSTAQATKYYQHRHGGVYYVNNPRALSTVDKSEWVVYTHVCPFDRETWIRPKSEWEDEGRFRELSIEEFEVLYSRDRTEFQEEIRKSKEESKKV